jgi:hypothetical protein
VNLIPKLGGLLFPFEELTLRKRGNQLVAGDAGLAPYIFLRGDDGQVRIYDGRDVPSQYIRRRITNHFRRDDWDWAVFPRLDVIEQTIALWKFR